MCAKVSYEYVVRAVHAYLLPRRCSSKVTYCFIQELGICARLCRSSFSKRVPKDKTQKVPCIYPVGVVKGYVEREDAVYSTGYLVKTDSTSRLVFELDVVKFINLVKELCRDKVYSIYRPIDLRKHFRYLRIELGSRVRTYLVYDSNTMTLYAEGCEPQGLDPFEFIDLHYVVLYIA